MALHEGPRIERLRTIKTHVENIHDYLRNLNRVPYAAKGAIHGNLGMAKQLLDYLFYAVEGDLRSEQVRTMYIPFNEAMKKILEHPQGREGLIAYFNKEPENEAGYKEVAEHFKFVEENPDDVKAAISIQDRVDEWKNFERDFHEKNGYNWPKLHDFPDHLRPLTGLSHGSTKLDKLLVAELENVRKSLPKSGTAAPSSTGR